jgi:hypothetical protein
MDTKCCTKCARIMHIAQFAWRDAAKTRRFTRCKQCEQGRQALRWAESKRRAGEWKGEPPSKAEIASRELLAESNRWRYPVAPAQLRQAVA